MLLQASRYSSAVFLLLASSAALRAQTGTSIITVNPLSCFAMELADGASATLSTVNTTGPGFTQALDIKSTAAGPNSWDIRPRCWHTQAVKQTDVIVLTFYMRTITPPQGQTQGSTTFVWENSVAATNYAKSVSFTADAGSDWTRFDTVFSPLANYDATTSSATTDPLAYNLSFWSNATGQEIQVGGIQVLDYGPNFDATTLNLPDWPYVGHDPNAAWRQQALARIEQIRAADVAVVLRDAKGNPIPNASVRVQMLKHAFGWGTAIDGSNILTETKYQQAVLANFNKLVPENDLKWGDFESYARPYADNDFSFAAANGYNLFRGHNLIWPGVSVLPADVVTLVNSIAAKGAANDAAEVNKLNTRIDTHFATMLNYTKGRVTEWDVVNEPYGQQDVVKALGQSPTAPPVMVHWYQEARQLDPTIKLYLNDYCLVECGDLTHMSFTGSLLTYLLAQGAPVDGLGLQSHIGSNLIPPEQVFQLLDYWAGFGLDLQVTEFDVNIADEQLQSDYARDYIIACFSHPKMAGFMLWGFFGGHDWISNPLFYNADWTERKAHQMWRDLVYGAWWTDVTGTTGPDGVYRTRAFLGDYDISYTINGTTTTVPYSVVAGKTNYVQVGAASSAPVVTAANIVNAASLQSGAVAPGELVRITGTGIGTSKPQAVNAALNAAPTELALTQVSFDGIPATLVDAGAGQALAVVPTGIQNPTSLVVRSMQVPSAPVSLASAAAAPAFFTCTGQSAVPLLIPISGTNAESCLSGTARATAGETIALFATGLASGGTNTVLFGGAPAPACAASATTLIEPGVWQIVTCAPASAGPVSVTLQSGTIVSPAVQITVH